MKYTFDILGVSPVLDFFNQQQQLVQMPHLGVQYLGTHKCTLDALLVSIEISLNRSWDLERVADTVIDFWMNNSDCIRYWKARLNDAGSENILISRVADIKSLQDAFELLLGRGS